jgi:hypothetical protein
MHNIRTHVPLGTGHRTTKKGQQTKKTRKKDMSLKGALSAKVVNFCYP